MRPSYPNAPGFKVDGTSRQAAAAVTPIATTLRERVAALFESGAELTADECAARLGESILAIRPRLSELRANNAIEDSGARRRNASGQTANVWRKTTKPKWTGQGALL